jgi:hypothetical protein
MDQLELAKVSFSSRMVSGIAAKLSELIATEGPFSNRLIVWIARVLGWPARCTRAFSIINSGEREGERLVNP